MLYLCTIIKTQQTGIHWSLHWLIREEQFFTFEDLYILLRLCDILLCNFWWTKKNSGFNIVSTNHMKVFCGKMIYLVTIGEKNLNICSTQTRHHRFKIPTQFTFYRSVEFLVCEASQIYTTIVLFSVTLMTADCDSHVHFNCLPVLIRNGTQSISLRKISPNNSNTITVNLALLNHGTFFSFTDSGRRW